MRIIKPRVEEILELVRDRLKNAGFAAQAGRRVVLTGGASQLVGLARDCAKKVLQGQIRIGRPLGIKGLPEAAKGPAFSAAVGLLVYPQVAHAEHFEPRSGGFRQSTGTDGYFSRRSGAGSARVFETGCVRARSGSRRRGLQQPRRPGAVGDSQKRARRS